ncbi:hypothetical protein E4U31_006634 [Claviceps sp. LM219 group G6]|nr:hypothetical protein E4U31_006634 [Claviceps sp. LM219 group G6]
MSSNTTVPTPARRPEISAARGHLRSFADVMGEELDVNSSLPALQQQDGVEWDELRNQVHGHENLLTAVQGAVTVTRGDFTTLQDEVTRIRGDVTTLQGQFTTFQGQFTAFQNVVAGLGNDTTRIQDNVTVLTENVRLLGEGLGAQIRAVSESTDHLTNLMNNQAGVNTRLEALLIATARRMTEILSELGEPPQASVRGRRRELKKLYGADLLLMRVVGEEEDSD